MSPITFLNKRAEELLLDIYKNNPEFNSQLLLEKYISSKEFLPELFPKCMEIVENISILKHQFFETHQQMTAKTSYGATNVFAAFFSRYDAGSIAEDIEKSVSSLSLPDSVSLEISHCCEFESLILAYFAVTTHKTVVKNLIEFNFQIATSYNYFQDVKDSNKLVKLYHLLRIAPQVTYEFLSSAYKDFGATKFDKQTFRKFEAFCRSRILENAEKLGKMPFVLMQMPTQSFVGINSIEKRAREDVVSKLAQAWSGFMSIYRYPITLVDAYYDEKIHTIDEVKTTNVKKLGRLILDSPKFDKSSDLKKESLAFLQNLNSIMAEFDDVSFEAGSNELKASISAKNVAFKVPNFTEYLSKSALDLKEPGFLASNWPIVAILTFYGPRILIDAINSREQIYNWIRTNLIDTIAKFGSNWIVKPVLNIVATIRHDDNSQISLTGKKSLSSDIDSLERMIVDYLEKTNGSVDIATIKSSIHQGDLTPFMKSYEQQISHPIKNLVVGDLLQSLLIQVQKVKVDGDLVINGIDKLLKSQELVFGFIAVTPTMLIVLWTISNMRILARKGWAGLFEGGLGRSRLLVKRSISRIETLLIYSKNDELTVGELAIELMILRKNIIRLVPLAQRKELQSDLHSLKGDLPREDKLRVVEKVWRSYGGYFALN